MSSQAQFRDVVRDTLVEKPATRDNDWLLFGGVMLRLRGINYMKNISLYDFIIEASNDKDIPKPSTSTRYRCAIQKDEPGLRGETYKDRQKYSKTYREEFRNGR